MLYQTWKKIRFLRTHKKQLNKPKKTKLNLKLNLSLRLSFRLSMSLRLNLKLFSFFCGSAKSGPQETSFFLHAKAESVKGGSASPLYRLNLFIDSVLNS